MRIVQESHRSLNFMFKSAAVHRGTDKEETYLAILSLLPNPHSYAILKNMNGIDPGAAKSPRRTGYPGQIF